MSETLNESLDVKLKETLKAKKLLLSSFSRVHFLVLIASVSALRIFNFFGYKIF